MDTQETNSSSTVIDRICENLKSSYQLGVWRYAPTQTPRFVALRKNELFDKLVQLYQEHFKTHWSTFNHATAAYTDTYATVNDRILFTATCYVSGWFWDLHVTIRECVRNLDTVEFVQYFSYDDFDHRISDEYDPFLQHLNSIIRPTHIQMALEDALYIPIISETLNLDRNDGKSIGNVFGLPNFHVDECVTHALIYIMRRKDFNVVSLSTHDFGRPGWLFDYRLGYAYSWFPMEKNYSFADLIAPHILGIPLTPRLGPRDVDEWQMFPGGALPTSLDLNDCQRISPRRFFGSAEYTTLEHEIYTLPVESSLSGLPHSGSKRATSDRSSTFGAELQQMEPLSVNRYRLVHWTYHHEVITGFDQQTRNFAFRSFVLKAGRTVATSEDGK